LLWSLVSSSPTYLQQFQFLSHLSLLDFFPHFHCDSLHLCLRHNIYMLGSNFMLYLSMPKYSQLYWDLGGLVEVDIAFVSCPHVVSYIHPCAQAHYPLYNWL
jgi:hypothetical protein